MLTNTMKEYLKLMRVHQWVKNVVLFLPLFFALEILDLTKVGHTAIAVLGFSLVASSIYILNDYFDREADAKHPVKKERPLAKGTIKPQAALILMVVINLIGLALVYISNMENHWGFYLTLTYLVMNLAYSFKLKHIPILDVCIIATGFVLRILIGGNVSGVEITEWIVIMAFLLALFLALAKRRDDVLLDTLGKKVRKSIDGYNLEFINGAMMIMASVTIVGYIMYTLNDSVIERFGDQNKIFYTTFFVILGILRYMQITFVEKKSGSPTKILLKDIFLQLVLAGWIIAFVLLIYLK